MGGMICICILMIEYGWGEGDRNGVGCDCCLVGAVGRDVSLGGGSCVALAWFVEEDGVWYPRLYQ